MNPRLRFLGGAALAAAAVSILSWKLPWVYWYGLHSALLVLTGGIYVGIALVDGRVRMVAIESAQVLAIMALLVAGWVWHPLFFAAAWLLHPLWDALHRHPGTSETPPGVIHWCLVFDLVVGTSVLVQALLFDMGV